MTALLALMMSLVLTACSAAPVTNVRTAPPPAAVLQAAEEDILFVVETEVWEDTAVAEDGTLLASYRFILPVLRVVRGSGGEVETAQNAAEERALEVKEAFNQRFAEWTAAREFAGLAREAQEALDWQREEGLPWGGGYELELVCGVYQTETLISVSGTYYSNTGGAHPNTWQLGWNFDLEQGVFFEPEFLSEGADLGDAVTAEIIRQANEPQADGWIPAEGYWEDYESIAANWSSYAVSFDEAGMSVTFSPYELAAYAAGPQTFQISYEWLSPHLSDHGREILGLRPLKIAENETA